MVPSSEFQTFFRFVRPAEIMVLPLEDLKISPGKAPGIPWKIELEKQWPPYSRLGSNCYVHMQNYRKFSPDIKLNLTQISISG